MHHPYSRVFKDLDEVEAFMTNVLRLNANTYPDIVFKIAQAEKDLLSTEISKQTLTSTSYRDRNYKSPNERWKLRSQIIEELLTYSRLEKDDDIKLGIGGAIPVKGIQSEYKAFIIIGLPASGKSTIANKIADENGAIILDSDYAKRKLPEYSLYPAGASLVHDESSAIISKFTKENDNLNSVYTQCLMAGHNMVIPKIGNDIKGIKEFAMVLTEAKYETHLILVSLSREDATKRAIKRLDETGRYIPLGLIFDVYGNDPILTYYLLRTKYPTLFSSYGAISTLTKPPSCVDILNETPCKDFNLDNDILI